MARTKQRVYETMNQKCGVSWDSLSITFNYIIRIAIFSVMPWNAWTEYLNRWLNYISLTVPCHILIDSYPQWTQKSFQRQFKFKLIQFCYFVSLACYSWLLSSYRICIKSVVLEHCGPWIKRNCIISSETVSFCGKNIYSSSRVE